MLHRLVGKLPNYRPLLHYHTAINMADLANIRNLIKTQGEHVKTLKEQPKPDKEAIENAVKKLNELKQELEKIMAPEIEKKKKNEALRSAVEDIATQRFFFVPSFEIYGGVSGLYDLGPPGCALRDNIVNVWKNHFILQEQMLEVFTAALTPEPVLKTSGHVDRFTDFMVRDFVTNDPYRADKILQEHIEKLLEDIQLPEAKREELKVIHSKSDDYDAKQLYEVIQELKVKSPAGNDLSEPFAFNLMFETQIGPSGKARGFMRPETAQGIFTNFRRLLKYNNDKMPFAAAQIGPAFRNEISPRSGLLRVREFTLAEIEHFVHKDRKSHHKFASIANLEVRLLHRNGQGLGDDEAHTVKLTLGKAVQDKLINNETLAYFMGRTHLFLMRIGIDPNRLRFRQHKSNEMAHYASDCWDAEIKSSYGWVECVGHADRSCFDLEHHSEAVGVDLQAQIVYDEPKLVKELKAKVNKGKLGPRFKGDAPKVMEYLTKLPANEGLKLQAELDAHGKATITNCNNESFEVTKDLVSFEMVETKLTTEKYTPAVIEPSFGIGRILYSLLEHSYHVREEEKEQRRILSLKPVVAPIKASILPLSPKDELLAYVSRIGDSLVSRNISINPDTSSAAIGKRYSRADELGIPFGITIDFETPKNDSVTIRDRDSLQQVRVGVNEVADIIEKLVMERTTWDKVYETYPKFVVQAEN